MTKFLISFDDGAMVFPDEDLPAVARAALDVVNEARDAEVWVFGGGLTNHREATIVGLDASVVPALSERPQQHLGGFAVVDVASRAEAERWAAKFAVACRCAQEVREFVPDPNV